MPTPQVWLREAIEAAAGCNAYPLDAPEGAAPPYVVYTRNSTVRELVLEDALGDPAGGSSVPPVAQMTVEVYRDDYVQVWETSAAIVAAVHGYAGDGIESALVLDEKDGSPVFMDGRDLPTYVVELSIEIRWSE